MQGLCMGSIQIRFFLLFVVIQTNILEFTVCISAVVRFIRGGVFRFVCILPTSLPGGYWMGFVNPEGDLEGVPSIALVMGNNIRPSF